MPSTDRLEQETDGLNDELEALRRELAQCRERERSSRRQAEALEAIYRRAPVGLCMFDAQGRFVRVNEYLAEMNGMPAGEHLGKHFEEVVPDLASQIAPLLHRVAETGEAEFDRELSGETPAQPGVERHWNTHWLPLRDNGQAWGVSVVVKETTEQRHQNEISQREQEFRSLADHVPDDIARYDRSLRYLYVNPSMAANAGIPRERFTGRTDRELGFPEELLSQWEPAMRQALETGHETHLAFRYLTPLGKRYFETRLVPEFGADGRVETLLAVTRDLTARKQTEDILQNAAHALAERVKELNCLYTVASLTQQPTRPLAEVLQGTVDALAVAYQYPEVTCARVMVDGQSHCSTWFEETQWRQTEALAAGGHVIGTVEVFYREERPDADEGPFLKEERDLLRAVAELLGRSLQERHEWQARRHAEAELNEAQRLAHLGSWEWDIAQDRATWSDEMFRIAGYEPGALAVTRASATGVVHPDDRERFSQILSEAMATNQGFFDEHRVIRPDGSVRVVERRGETIADANGRVMKLRGTWLDVTDRRQAEEALRRANTELQQFAHVAAHDLRAPLRAVSNLTTWLESDLGEQLSGESREHLHLMRERVQLMDAMILGLLAYSEAGGRTGDIVEVDSGQLVRDLLKGYDLPDGLEVILPDDMPRLVTDRTQLQQVFANLIGNAIKYHDKPRGHIWVAGRAVDGTCEFTVTDDGPGIPPEYHERVFLMLQRGPGPKTSDGTGIGLAIVKKVVEGVGGHIELESSPGSGTTFRFTWPRVMGRAASP